MATIKENYCSKEIYRLLIEKGFDGEVHTTFNKVGYTQPSITLQMAMKWLRKKYYIYADPIKQGNYNDCSEYYTWIVARMGIIHRNSSVADKLSYEEAVEAALKYSLENLI